MKRNNANPITWLRVSYWVGAIVDFIFAVILIFSPSAARWLWQLETPVEGAELMWAQYFGSIVFAWTCVLLWADRKPLARRGIILLTSVPVLVGIMAVEIQAMITGVAPVFNLVLLLGMQSGLMILFLFSYFNSSNLFKENSKRMPPSISDSPGSGCTEEHPVGSLSV